MNYDCYLILGNFAIKMLSYTELTIDIVLMGISLISVDGNQFGKT